MGYTLENVKRLQEMLNRPEEPDTRPRDPMSTARRIMAHTQGNVIGGLRFDLATTGPKKPLEEYKASFFEHFDRFDDSTLPENYRQEFRRIRKMAEEGNWSDSEFLVELSNTQRRFYGATE